MRPLLSGLNEMKYAFPLALGRIFASMVSDVVFHPWEWQIISAYSCDLKASDSAGGRSTIQTDG
jgi:hypothetical protein